MKENKKKILFGAIIALIITTVCFFVQMFSYIADGQILVEGNDLIYFTIEYVLFFNCFTICLVMELIYEYKKNERIIPLKKRMARYIILIFACFIPIAFFQGRLSEKYTTSMAALNKNEDNNNSQPKNNEIVVTSDANIEKDSKSKTETKEKIISSTTTPLQTEKVSTNAEKKQNKKIKATKKPNQKKKEKSDYKLIFSEHAIKGAPDRSENEKEFVKQLKKICKKYTVTKLYVEYQIEGSIYAEIACSASNLDDMTDEIVKANSKTEYNSYIMISFVDEKRYKDNSAEDIVWKNVDIHEDGSIYEY